MVNCLVVDDEPIARDILVNYCAALPSLHIVAECENAIDAKLQLQNHPVQIMFLDINMPVLDGIGFLKTLKHPPQVIFTTAYKEYAVHAFDLYACDYLVKPFSLERFIVAVDKAFERIGNLPAPSAHNQQSLPNDYMFIKSEGKTIRLNYRDILFAEARGNYTQVATESRILLTATNFSSFQSLLPGNLFIRVHRSFIVNTSRITHIEGNSVYVNKNEIPIGNSYKDGFLKFLGL